MKTLVLATIGALWGAYGLNLVPSLVQPLPDYSIAESVVQLPIGHTFRYAIDCDPSVGPFIPLLSSPISPTHIANDVPLRIVNSVESVARWGISKRSIESFKGPEFVAQADLPVKFKILIVRVGASANHRTPCGICFSSGFPMGSTRGGKRLRFLAPTGNGVAIAQPSAGDCYCLPAYALAFPHGTRLLFSIVPIRGASLNEQMANGLSRHIDKNGAHA